MKAMGQYYSWVYQLKYENDQGKFCWVIDWDKDPIINSGAISKTLILSSIVIWSHKIDQV
jgi:hypothetical protein